METGGGGNQRRMGLQPPAAFHLHLFQLVHEKQGTDWRAAHCGKSL